jgi:hypothetical protein
VETTIYIRTKVTDPSTLQLLMNHLSLVLDVVDEDASMFAVPTGSPVVNVNESFDVSVQRSLDVVKEDR